MIRCGWVGESDIYINYHDNEWGKPEFDSIKLFEMLCLEGQQAGLSWITVLKKRDNYRKAFYMFDPYKISQMKDKDIDLLMQNSGLIRHRIKLEAIVKNAKAYLLLEQELAKYNKNFSSFLWDFVEHQPKINDIPSQNKVVNKNNISKAMSIALKKYGFVFVGEIICYSFMQSMGLVNDHINDCYCKCLK